MSNPQDLKSIGLKATFPRLKILDIFQKTTSRHLTAEDIYRHLINEGMDIGLATVYRVLTQFEQAGLLLKDSPDARALFDYLRAPAGRAILKKYGFSVPEGR